MRIRRASRKPQRGFLYITPRKKNDAVGQENIENMEPWFSLCVFLRENRSRRGQWRHSIHIQYTTPRNDAWFSVDLTIWMGKFILQPNIAIENHPISTIIYDLWENIYLNQSMFDCHLGFVTRNPSTCSHPYLPSPGRTWQAPNTFLAAPKTALLCGCPSAHKTPRKSSKYDENFQMCSCNFWKNVANWWKIIQRHERWRSFLDSIDFPVIFISAPHRKVPPQKKMHGTILRAVHLQ